MYLLPGISFSCEFLVLPSLFPISSFSFHFLCFNFILFFLLSTVYKGIVLFCFVLFAILAFSVFR